MNEFKFSLHQKVQITVSGESGEIWARSEYAHAENTYLVHYKAADGRAVRAWWDESTLSEA
ncbi:MAG: hypothetical protein ABL934_03115 [Lysobacteraceae bacterium]